MSTHAAEVNSKGCPHIYKRDLNNEGSECCWHRLEKQSRGEGLPSVGKKMSQGGVMSKLYLSSSGFVEHKMVVVSSTQRVLCSQPIVRGDRPT